MRFERIPGPGRPAPRRSAPRRPRPPEITRAAEGAPSSGPAARRDRAPVKLSSYAAVSITVSVLLFGFFLLGDRGFLEVRRQRQRLAALQAEVSSLAAEDEALEAEVSRLKADPAAAEKIAREELNFVRPGDVVLVLPDGWRDRVSRLPSPPPSPKKVAGVLPR